MISNKIIIIIEMESISKIVLIDAEVMSFHVSGSTIGQHLFSVQQHSLTEIISK